MKKVYIASKNPVKIACVEKGFSLVWKDEEFSYEGVSVESGVGDQPMSDEETLLGALNRAQNAKLEFPDGDYWVGVEGGIEVVEGGMFCFAWVVVVDDVLVGRARSAGFELPERVAELIHEGVELGDADDTVFGKSNSKQENGAVGILSKDVITRTELYVPAVVLALIPWGNSELY